MAQTKLSADTTRILRHLVATIAYRASHSLRDAPEGFEDVRLAEGGMSAKELVQHMANVMSFALSVLANKDRIRHDAMPWAQQVDDFYSVLRDVDAQLAQGASVEDGMVLKLVQGPLADSLTHVGQLHSMRRKFGAPIAPANYIKADIPAMW